MEFDFLVPLNKEIVDFISMMSSQHLGNKMVLHTNDSIPDLDKINIAIIGILDNRGNVASKVKLDLNPIRKQLYGMFPGNWKATLADLGDVLAGDTKEDTYFAVKKIVSTLIKKNCIPLIIGGSQD